MELASMLLNQLSNNASLIGSNKQNSVNKNSFGNFLENAKNNTKVQQNNRQKSKSLTSEDNKKLANTQTKDKKGSNIKTEKNSKSQKVETENSDDIEETKDKDKVIIFDEKLLNQLSEILGISTENIIAILSELSMPISQLQNAENLINFLQQAFNLESPVELLSKDGIKDIMTKINDLAKSIKYNDLVTNLEDIENIINNFNLNDVKLVNLENDDLQSKIRSLLDKFNGTVTEVNNENNINQQSSNFNGKTLRDEALDKIKEDNVEHLQNKNIDLKFKENFARNFNQQSSSFTQNQNSNLPNKELHHIKIETFNISEVVQNSKVFNASLPKTQALRNINSTEVISQILEKMKTTVKPDMTEVKILLRPEHLGEVSLKIATQNGTIVAQFTAESQKVKEVIESNFNQLKDMLLEQGIDVGSLEVNVSSENEQAEQFKQFANMQEKSSKTVQQIINNSFEEQDIEEKPEKVDIVNNSQVDYAI